MNTKDKIYVQLKTGAKTLDEIQANIGNIPKKEIARCLDQQIKKGWVEKSGNRYTLKHIFDPPLRQLQKAKNRDWVYEDIQGAVTRPVSYMNPYVDWLPCITQGNRGTCCGHAGCYASWLVQLKLLAEQLGLKKEDVLFREDMQVNVFGQCIMSTEKLHYMAPSAEGFYDESRRIENVTVPSGSYIRGVIRAWKDYGYNYEKDRMTSDDEKCAPMYYPIVGDEANTKKLLSEQAAEHRLDGYAEVNSWDGVKDAIWKYGACLVAVDLYENMEQNGCSGVFPDPRGGVIGSHALCACGYDENYIYVIHSWGNYWSKIGGFSKRYFNSAAGTSYVGIDSKDVGIAKDLYSVVNVVSNIPANINIAGDAYNGVLTAKASVKVGSSYQIRVTPSSPLYEPPAYTFDKVKLKEEETYTVDFQKRDNKSWIKKMIDAYLCKYLHKNC